MTKHTSDMLASTLTDGHHCGSVALSTVGLIGLRLKGGRQTIEVLSVLTCLACGLICLCSPCRTIISLFRIDNQLPQSSKVRCIIWHSVVE